MELSPERRQQIEEEERQRLAEEQYRSQVRAGLIATPSETVPAAPERRRSRLGLPLLVLAVAVIGGAMMFRSNRYNPAGNYPWLTSWIDSFGGSPRSPSGSAHSPSGSPSTPSIRYVLVTQKIATGEVVVKARGYVQYRFQITPEMRDTRISGSFNASGGSGNDVEAVIAAESEYMNWINDHQARVFYGTQGRKTTDNFDVRLGLGTYYFAVSNRFSALSDKYVFLNVDLNYSKVETY